MKTEAVKKDGEKEKKPFEDRALAKALEYIRKQAAAKPTNAWIVLEGLYPTRLTEGRLPTLTELDTAAPYNPVYWNAGAIGVANTTAINFSKITNSTANPFPR